MAKKVWYYGIIARGVKALNAIKRKPNIGADIVNIILYYYVLLFHVRKYFTTSQGPSIKDVEIFGAIFDTPRDLSMAETIV